MDGGRLLLRNLDGISGDIFYRNGSGADFTTVTNEWLDANIRSKGPLGKLYPQFAYIMEGDTPTFLGLIVNGLHKVGVTEFLKAEDYLLDVFYCRCHYDLYA